MTRLLLGACVCAVLSGSSAADELWRQNPIGAVGGYSSQDASNPGGLGWFSETADNFQAQAGWTISGVEFWGGYVAATPGATQGFTVRFYADNGGAIGQRLSTQDVSVFSETVYYTLQPQGWNGYHYALTLPQPLTVPQAGTYWMSIVALLGRGGDADPNTPQWGWVQALNVTPPSAQQWFFAPGNFGSTGADMSFVLQGTIGAPEGVCCRGAVCSTAVPQADCTPPTAHAGARFVSGAGGCNSGGDRTSPCCEADYNKAAGVTVQDLFDFLGDWFTGSPFAHVGGDGTGGAPTVQSLFDFLAAWFAGCP